MAILCLNYQSKAAVMSVRSQFSLGYTSVGTVYTSVGTVNTSLGTVHNDVSTVYTSLGKVNTSLGTVWVLTVRLVEA